MRKMKSNSIFYVKQQKKRVTANEQGNAQPMEVAEQLTHALMDGHKYAAPVKRRNKSCLGA